MSPTFIKGVGENLPHAASTFDKVHAVEIVTGAVDAVRLTEHAAQSAKVVMVAREA